MRVSGQDKTNNIAAQPALHLVSLSNSVSSNSVRIAAAAMSVCTLPTNHYPSIHPSLSAHSALLNVIAAARLGVNFGAAAAH